MLNYGKLLVVLIFVLFFFDLDKCCISLFVIFVVKVEFVIDKGKLI